MEQKKNHSSLSLQGLSIPVNLGCSDEERKIKQTIILDIVLYFKVIPQACHTDILNDTICYDKLVKEICDFCKSKDYCLIEHLGYEVYKLLKNKLSEEMDVKLSITKCNPSLNLKQSVFTIGD